MTDKQLVEYEVDDPHYGPRTYLFFEGEEPAGARKVGVPVAKKAAPTRANKARIPANK